MSDSGITGGIVERHVEMACRMFRSERPSVSGQSESSKLCNFDQTHDHIVGAVTRYSLLTPAGLKTACYRICLTSVPRSRLAASGSRSAVLPLSEAGML